MFHRLRSHFNRFGLLLFNYFFLGLITLVYQINTAPDDHGKHDKRDMRQARNETEKENRKGRKVDGLQRKRADQWGVDAAQ